MSNGSSLKIDFPLISIIVFASKKNPRIKQYCFQLTKSLTSLARMKYWLKYMLQLAAISEKWRKIISTGRKSSFPPARISCFFQNCFLLIPIMISTSSKIVLTKRILFPLGAKSVSTSWMKDIEKYVTTIWKRYFYF